MQEAGAVLYQDLAGPYLPPLGRQIQRSLKRKVTFTLSETNQPNLTNSSSYLSAQQILGVDVSQAGPLQEVPQYCLVTPLGRDVQHRLPRSATFVFG